MKNFISFITIGFLSISNIWKIVRDKLLFSIIILLISSLISYLISRKMKKTELRNELYIDELKEMKNLLKKSINDMKQDQPIFKRLCEIGYIDGVDFEHKISTLSLDNKRFKKLLKQYLELIEKYNDQYFKWNDANMDKYGALTGDIKERSKILKKYHKDFYDLFQKINKKIEKIIV